MSLLDGTMTPPTHSKLFRFLRSPIKLHNYECTRRVTTSEQRQAREVLPFADTLLPPTVTAAPAATARDAADPKPPRYLLRGKCT